MDAQPKRNFGLPCSSYFLYCRYSPPTSCWSQVFLRGSCWQDCTLPFLGNSYHPSHP